MAESERAFSPENEQRPPFNRVGVLDRGEMAIRAVAAAKKLEIPHLVLYLPDWERDTLPAEIAIANGFEIITIGGESPHQLYVRNFPSLLERAIKDGVDALYPAYGPTAEKPAIARMIENNGITYIGSSPESMEVLGNKIAARDLARSLGIPVVPGTDIVRTKTEATRAVRQIKPPFISKLAGGGGGFGMQIYDDPEDFLRNFDGMINLFNGYDGAYLERYIPGEHHEVQILADKYGKITILDIRNCSAQRGHKKQVEITDSSEYSPETRAKLNEWSTKLVKAANFEGGVCTVEFLYDPHTKEWYFNGDVNTRIQVEHGVSEEVNGSIDLVKQQILLAAGKPLPRYQLRTKPVAIQTRIYFYDPNHGFTNTTGRIEDLDLNKILLPGERIDQAYGRGNYVPFTPEGTEMLGFKFITTGDNRMEAITNQDQLLRRFLQNYRGPKTTAAFNRAIITTREFQDATMPTNYIDNNLGKLIETSQRLDV